MNRLVSSLCFFWGTITLGSAARRLRFVGPEVAPRVIQLMASWVAPPVALLSMWIMDLRHLTLVSLPFLGAAVSFASLLPAWWLARRWHLPSTRRGSWLLGACFSNVGYLGAIVAFAVWGEQAYGLCTLYFLLFSPMVYTIGYAIGGRYRLPMASVAVNTPLELWRWTPVVGTAIGLALSWGGVPRPRVCGLINHALIPLMTGAYLFIVGTTMRVSHVTSFLREGAWMSAIKLVYAPLVGAGLAVWLGYPHLLDGLAWRVVLLESSMPTAVTSLTLPALFGLDQDFANSLWIITALGSMLVIPVLLWVLR